MELLADGLKDVGSLWAIFPKEKSTVLPGTVAYAFHPSAPFWKERQVELCEFKVSPFYTESSKAARDM